MATRKSDPKTTEIADLKKLLETKSAEVELLTTHLKAAEERGDRFSQELVYARQYNEELRRHNSILSESEARLSTSVTTLAQQTSALMSQNISLRHPSAVVSEANRAFTAGAPA